MNRRPSSEPEPFDGVVLPEARGVRDESGAPEDREEPDATAPFVAGAADSDPFDRSPLGPSAAPESACSGWSGTGEACARAAPALPASSAEHVQRSSTL